MGNHRAGRRQRTHAASPAVTPRPPKADVPRSAVSNPSSSAGKRKAVKPTHVGSRKNLLPGMPSAPTLVGAAALVLAAGGAITLGEGGGSTSPAAASDGINLTQTRAAITSTSGSAVVSASISERVLAVSRDSQRQALADAADAELKEAAEAQAEQRNAALAKLAASAQQHADQIAANQWQLPIPAGVYRLSATFGLSSSLWSSTHTGLDFAAPSGTPLLAVANGVITSTEYDGSYGNKTVLTLEDGTEIWYAHQTSFAASPGDTVRAGELIGYVGSTGNSTGPHLHLEVRPGAGDPVDPMSALQVHGLNP